MSLLRSSIIIFRKDIRSELRTRYVTNSLLMFVLVTISIIKFALGDEKTENEILNGLLWVTIFFTASNGLSRVFVKEEEKETSAALKMSVNPSAVLIGKLIYNIVLTIILNLFIITLFIAITDYEIKNIPGFLIVILTGNIGLVAASTIIAAIISKASSKGTLYPVLSFPILIPLLVTVINATNLTSMGVSIGNIITELQVLISYSVVVIAASLILFAYVWED